MAIELCRGGTFAKSRCRKCLFLALEGDLAAAGDSAAIDGTALANAANRANNVFNSTVSSAGVIAADRDPNYVNTLGWDVDLFSTLNVLGNDRTSATVELATTLDAYAPGCGDDRDRSVSRGPVSPGGERIGRLRRTPQRSADGPWRDSRPGARRASDWWTGTSSPE